MKYTVKLKDGSTFMGERTWHDWLSGPTNAYIFHNIESKDITVNKHSKLVVPTNSILYMVRQEARV